MYEIYIISPPGLQTFIRYQKEPPSTEDLLILCGYNGKMCRFRFAEINNKADEHTRAHYNFHSFVEDGEESYG